MDGEVVDIVFDLEEAKQAMFDYAVIDAKVRTYRARLLRRNNLSWL